MTPNQFVKIAMALNMTIDEVNAMIDGRRPKLNEVRAEAKRMAAEVEEHAHDGNPDTKAGIKHWRDSLDKIDILNKL